MQFAIISTNLDDEVRTLTCDLCYMEPLMRKRIILLIYGIFFFFSILGIASMLTACSQQEPSPADSMADVSSNTQMLVWRSLEPFQRLQTRKNGSRVDILLDESEITEKIYGALASAICFDHITKKSDFSTVGEIRFWNQRGTTGYAMLLPHEQCVEYSQGTGDNMDTLIQNKRLLGAGENVNWQ